MICITLTYIKISSTFHVSNNEALLYIPVLRCTPYMMHCVS